ncbi:hypothetical protein OAV88_02990 [bacterium]|nr:hypothetical protein [bacterium]
MLERYSLSLSFFSLFLTHTHTLCSLIHLSLSLSFSFSHSLFLHSPTHPFLTYIQVLDINSPGSIVAISGQGTTQVKLVWDGTSIETTFNIYVIDAQSLNLNLRSYPSFIGSNSYHVTELKEIENTGKYQRAIAEVILTLSNGEEHDVSTQSELTTSNASVIQISSNNVMMKANQTGNTSIQATFGSFACMFSRH